MLWLALHFPQLPIEALSIASSPSALMTRGRIVLPDPQAQAAGVAAGQRVATALGLLPGLCVVERDPACEQAALLARACWAGRFTPTLSLRPAMLCLEIGACRRLFGGLSALRQTILDGLAEAGWQAAWAIAPTPQGADWLARAGGGQICESMAQMRICLDALPWQVVDWPAPERARLEAFGLRTLGELRALPSAALRQRLGSTWIDALCRAYGDLPDPQKYFVFPESFALSLELPARIEHAEALAFGARRLFAALAGWLHARQLQWRRGCLELQHPAQAATRLELAVSEATADAERLLRLLRERLSRLQLAAPVEALRLLAEEVTPLRDETQALFAGDQHHAGEGVQACLDRLRARLGETAVQALVLRPEYRPECASHYPAWLSGATAQHAGSSTQQGGSESLPTTRSPFLGGLRPAWLLPQPQALAERDGRPQWHGPLQLLTRPERIESGWWDGGESGAVGDIRRDYFVASNALGQRAWVFRDASGWYLHGLFA